MDDKKHEHSEHRDMDHVKNRGMHGQGQADASENPHRMHRDDIGQGGDAQGHGHGTSAGGHVHHAMMLRDFKRRFILSLLLTVPILVLSPVIQGFLGLNLQFSNQGYLVFALSTILFLFGGKPFLLGARDELKQKAPAMMTLIAFAISVSYIYSSLTVFL